MGMVQEKPADMDQDMAGMNRSRGWYSVPGQGWYMNQERTDVGQKRVSMSLGYMPGVGQERAVVRARRAREARVWASNEVKH